MLRRTSRIGFHSATSVHLKQMIWKLYKRSRAIKEGLVWFSDFTTFSVLELSEYCLCLMDTFFTLKKMLNLSKIKKNCCKAKLTKIFSDYNYWTNQPYKQTWLIWTITLSHKGPYIVKNKSTGILIP